MEKYDVDELTAGFGNLLEGDNLDKKYPSAYLPKFIKSIIEFIKWAIDYIDEEVSGMKGELKEGLSDVNSKMDQTNNDLDKQKTDIAALDSKIDGVSNSNKKYTDDAISKLKDDLGI